MTQDVHRAIMKKTIGKEGDCMLLFLMSVADEGDRNNIARIYHRYHEKMLRVSFRRFKQARRHDPQSDAEDAVQSTFLNIVRYVRAVPFDKPERQLRAYVFAMLHNEISKILAEPELPLEDSIENMLDEESLQEFGERVHIRERYREVVTAIRDMEPKYSTVLLLCFGEEMTVKQAAEALGISPSTVYTRLRRGKQLLLEKFAKEDE